MIDKTKKYKTRSGDDVRIYATDGAGAYAVHGARLDSSLGWQSERWMPDGRYTLDPGSRFGLVPAPILRPWTHSECPVVFMARGKASPEGMSSVAWRHYPPSCQGVNFFPARVCDGAKLVIDLSFLDLAADYVRILEDGSEVPCGVEEAAWIL